MYVMLVNLVILYFYEVKIFKRPVLYFFLYEFPFPRKIVVQCNCWVAKTTMTIVSPFNGYMKTSLAVRKKAAQKCLE